MFEGEMSDVCSTDYVVISHVYKQMASIQKAHHWMIDEKSAYNVAHILANMNDILYVEVIRISDYKTLMVKAGNFHI